MNITPQEYDPGTVDQSCFDVDEQKPVHPEKLVQALNMLTNSDEFATTHRILVPLAIKQISKIDLNQCDERVKKAVNNYLSVRSQDFSKINIDRDNVVDLLKFSCAHEVQPLIDRCAAFIKANGPVNSEILILAHMYNLKPVIDEYVNEVTDSLKSFLEQYPMPDQNRIYTNDELRRVLAGHKLAFLSYIRLMVNLPQLDPDLVERVISRINHEELHFTPGLANNPDVIALKRAWPTLTIGGRTVRVHRSVLETSSPQFRDKLTNKNSVALEAPKKGEVADLVFSYLRTGVIGINNDNLIDLLAFSCEHQLEPLIRKCETYITKNMRHFSQEMDSGILALANKHNLGLVVQEYVSHLTPIMKRFLDQYPEPKQVEDGFYRTDELMNAQLSQKLRFRMGLNLMANLPQLDPDLVEHVISRVNDEIRLSNLEARGSVTGGVAEISEVIALKKAWPTLTIGGRSIHVHRSTLETSSPQFRKRLETNEDKTYPNSFTLEAPAKAETVDLIFSFFHTGVIRINNDNLMDLLAFSCEHQIDPLIKVCESYIKANFDYPSWLVLDNNKNPVDQKKFLLGLQFLANAPGIARTTPELVERVFGLLQSSAGQDWRKDNDMQMAVKEFIKAWPKVTIGSVPVYVSRVDLVQNSRMFKAMFSAGRQEENESSVTLMAPENAGAAASALRGVINIDSDNVADLLSFALLYRIEPLIAQCAAYLKQDQSINVDNVVDLFILFCQHRTDPFMNPWVGPLIASCLNYIWENLSEDQGDILDFAIENEMPNLPDVATVILTFFGQQRLNSVSSNLMIQRSVNYIIRNLSWAQFGDILDLAIKLKIPSLQEGCLAFAIENQDDAQLKKLDDKKRNLIVFAKQLREYGVDQLAKLREYHVDIELNSEGQAELIMLPGFYFYDISPDFTKIINPAFKLISDLNKAIPINTLRIKTTYGDDVVYNDDLVILSKELPDLEVFHFHCNLDKETEMEKLFPKLSSFDFDIPTSKG